MYQSDDKHIKTVQEYISANSKELMGINNKQEKKKTGEYINECTSTNQTSYNVRNLMGLASFNVS